jgi:hypothetical protein
MLDEMDAEGLLQQVPADGSPHTVIQRPAAIAVAQKGYD